MRQLLLWPSDQQSLFLPQSNPAAMEFPSSRLCNKPAHASAARSGCRATKTRGTTPLHKSVPPPRPEKLMHLNRRPDYLFRNLILMHNPVCFKSEHTKN